MDKVRRHPLAWRRTLWLVCASLLPSCQGAKPDHVTDPPAVDADGDGFFSTDDCDDAQAGAHPGATEPDCANDIDEDCDGEVDESNDGARCIEDGATTWIQELDDSHADGGAISIAGDLDGDGRSDLLLGGGGGWVPNLAGHVHVFLAANLGEGVVPTSAADWTLVGDEGTQAASGLLNFSGQGATFLPDIDSDGRSEVLVGAPLANDGAGAAYLVLGDWLVGAESSNLSLPGMALTEFLDASGTTEELGAVAAAGDVDGDGIGDMLFAGHEVAWMVPATAIDGLETDVGAGIKIVGPEQLNRTWFGDQVLPAGDLDGDGLSDVLATCFACGEQAYGQVFLFVGSSWATAGATTSSDSADRTISSSSPLGFGIAATGGADIDGDGLSDWVVASIGAEAADGVFVYVSGADEAPAEMTDADARSHLVPDEENRGWFGTALSLGDFDGDGAPDLAVQDNDEDEGFFIFRNSVLMSGGTVESILASPAFEPHDTDSFVGGAVRMDGDLDGDGRDDFVYADGFWGPYGSETGFGMALVIHGFSR